MLGSERVTAPLSLTRKGSGEPLLLLHGLGTSCRDFTAVLPELTDRFDVINVDLPGIGRSPHSRSAPLWPRSPMPSSTLSTRRG